MNSLTKTILLLLVLLGLVIAGSLLFKRGTQPGPQDRATNQLDRPPVPLHPELAAGLEALQQERAEEAAERFAAVPTSDPSYPVALDQLAALAIKRDDLDRAADLLGRLLELQPDRYDTLVRLAAVQFRLRRYVDAELNALRALEVNPDDGSLRYEVALYRLAQGQLARAINTYFRAVERDGDRAKVLRAVERLVQLGQERPELQDVHYALAFFARTTGQLDVEIEELESYLASEPHGVVADMARLRLAEARDEAASGS